MAFLSACGGGGSDAGTAPTPTPPAPSNTCSAAGVAASNASTLNTVCMLTTQGEIVVELEAAKSPITVANFLKYVTANRYDNTLYHRVVAGFVIQGGGYTASGASVATYAPITLESNNGLSNVRGTIAMARTSDPNSATSQFFFNTVDNSACLDRGKTVCDATGNGYAVFGRVISGLDTVDKIAAVSVDGNSQPRTNVVTYWAKQLK
ncbi:peptidyl-prolyl cis-trans isomerase [Albitalea terrae]|uniref:Peptidyl-prolyl cis-trans isomerase n=2 Tax=Piscinibacter terrae TaxID=2496871 RepID=A0A3N7I0B3_9BURK|nr:peptidyl-prolyl cis-trans isomerase [Albitalea terrae]